MKSTVFSIAALLVMLSQAVCLAGADAGDLSSEAVRADKQRSFTLHIGVERGAVDVEQAPNAVEGETVTLPDGRRAMWLRCHENVPQDRRSRIVSDGDHVLVFIGADDPELLVESVSSDAGFDGKPMLFLRLSEKDSTRLLEFTSRNIHQIAVVAHRRQAIQVARIVQPIGYGITVVAFEGHAAADFEQPSANTRQIDLVDVAKAMLLITFAVLAAYVSWKARSVKIIKRTRVVFLVAGAVILSLVATYATIEETAVADSVEEAAVADSVEESAMADSLVLRRVIHVSLLWTVIGAAVGALMGNAVAVVVGRKQVADQPA